PGLKASSRAWASGSRVSFEPGTSGARALSGDEGAGPSMLTGPSGLANISRSSRRGNGPAAGFTAGRGRFRLASLANPGLFSGCIHRQARSLYFPSHRGLVSSRLGRALGQRLANENCESVAHGRLALAESPPYLLQFELQPLILGLDIEGLLL